MNGAFWPMLISIKPFAPCFAVVLQDRAIVWRRFYRVGG